MNRRPPNQDDKKYANNLKRLIGIYNDNRVKNNLQKLNQSQIAKEIGVSPDMVSKYVNGIQPLGVAITLEFAKLLHVDPRQIKEDIFLPDIKESIQNKIIENELRWNFIEIETFNKLNKEQKQIITCLIEEQKQVFNKLITQFTKNTTANA